MRDVGDYAQIKGFLMKHEIDAVLFETDELGGAYVVRSDKNNQCCVELTIMLSPVVCGP